MGANLTVTDQTTGAVPSGPWLRVNRSDPLDLSTTWQTVAFTGTSVGNSNTFPGEVGSKLVEWDANAELFRFRAGGDRGYLLTFFVRVTAGSSPTVAQARLVVPSAIIYPFPETVQRLDLFKVDANEEWAKQEFTPLNASAPLRALGLKVQLRIRDASPGTVLNECIAALYGK